MFRVDGKYCLVGTLVSWFIVLLRVDVAVGWGRQGHEIVGNLAWQLVSSDTQSEIEWILSNQTNQVSKTRRASTSSSTNALSASKSSCPDCSPLGAVADWADTIRRILPWTAHLHYVDVRDDIIPGGCPAGVDANVTCQFNYTRDCPKDICVAGAIVNYSNIISKHYQSSKNTGTGMKGNEEYHEAKSGQSSNLLQDSLKFLTHFVGDIHQPLHVSRKTDYGGNSIDIIIDHQEGDSNQPPPEDEFHEPVRRVHDPVFHASNLHAVWDDWIIEKCLHEDFDGYRVALEGFLLEWLLEDEDHWKEWVKCPNGADLQCTKMWAQESLDDAIQWAYRNVDGTEIESGTTLSHAYYESRLPIVKLQLLAGAFRLAVTLEMVLQGTAEGVRTG